MKRYLTALAALAMCASVNAASVDVTMNRVSAEGIGASLGHVTISETEHGLLFTPKLHDLEPGVHGFHVHAKGSCEAAEKEGEKVAALAAGGHFDPESTGKHLGPYADGHLGDLPALFATADGHSDYPVLAPRLKTLDQIKGLALMVHAGGDNHSDHPLPLGGGGARMGCGVIN